MKETLNNRLEVGEKIFYYDGYTQWAIETVESINKAEKSALLSNNAHISRYPNQNGTFDKLNPNGGYVPNQPNLLIKRATPDMIKVRTAILSLQKIKAYIYQLNQGILKTTAQDDWRKWSEAKQNRLICLAGHLAKGIEEADLEEDDKEALVRALGEPREQVIPKKKKRK